MNNAPFSDEEVLAELLYTFPPALESKFREGMKKYASPLTAKNCLDEAFPEVMDLVVYLTAERMKRKLLLLHLHGANKYISLGKMDAAHCQILEAIRLVEPRPLAVKTNATSPSQQPASNA